MELLTAIYSSSFGNGLDAKRFSTTLLHGRCTQIIVASRTVIWGNGKEKKKDFCARFIRCIIVAEVFSVPGNHKGSFE